ncbi:hypothetical protein FNQ90_06885, partial [Streptomyces alkaliphilus]|nr:hypothetical protein [Streptomyces alkaliphilus]
MTDPIVPDPVDSRHTLSGAVAPTDPAGVDRLTLTVPDPAAMNRLGRALGGLLRAGDLVAVSYT